MTSPQPAPPTPAVGRTTWPGPGRGIAHEDLPKHLFTVAALHARRALAAAEEPLDLIDRATSIGSSVELLAKAALTLISPTLIAEKDARSLLLYAGVAVPKMSAHDAKTKSVSDCLLILKHSHSVNFNSDKDQKVFSVRNLAVHMGLVDSTQFDEALNLMVRINEEILGVVMNLDAALDRNTFWGTELLAQVNERLKEDQEARTLELEELKAAARRSLERLKERGFNEGALLELADRDPDIDDPILRTASDFDPERRTCPACGNLGWLGFVSTDRGGAYTETDEMQHEYWHLVDVLIEAAEFRCGACGLNLHADLLELEGMDETRTITIEATQEEIDARESYEIESYLERMREESYLEREPDDPNY